MTDSILYDGLNIALPHGTGIATYAKNLAQTARNLGYGTEVLVNVNNQLDRHDPVLNEIQIYDVGPRSPRENMRMEIRWYVGAPFGIKPVEVSRRGVVVAPSSNLSPFDRVWASPGVFDIGRYNFLRYGRPAELKIEKRPSLFHATFPAPLKVSGIPNVYTIHDIVPLRLPYTTLENKTYTLNLFRHLARRADHIVTVSEYSRQDIIKFLGADPSRVTSTGQCVQLPQALLDKSDQEVAREVETQFGLGYKEYFLFWGAVEPKKNVERLIDAYALTKSAKPLVIAGGAGWLNEQVTARIADERFMSYRIAGDRMVPSRQVRRLPYVDTTLLVSLIRGARAALFPSIYEGFGLPVLEAMLLGTPVMTSNVSSLPEIAGDAAQLIDPTSLEDIAKAIRRLDEDDDLCVELRRRGFERVKAFSPAQYQDRIDELYRSLLA